MDAVVSRLHQALAEAIRSQRSGRTGQPVSVAEIYQELVPYRTVRSAIGVEMNADYEYALLRLLAGEGGFARIEPAEARESLRLEIGSPNPNVTLYRKFAGCDVWVDLDRPGAALLTATVPAPRVFESAGPGAGGAAAFGFTQESDAPRTPDASRTPDPAERASTRSRNGLAGFSSAAPTASPFAFSEIEDARSAPVTSGRDALASEADPLQSVAFESAEEVALPEERKGDVAPPGSAAHECHACHGPLPGGRNVNFCPHCGSDQRRLMCNSCGDLLERSWRFCPGCGATVADPASGRA